ncbi:MAG: hypothetical protein GAK35_04169 [Herbaspirillum frisingense]|uniref:Uncharacterized protein n=1 Tax=Herbaspirillum frisingense TaxID=92645 RepID=A0A7V8FSY4_9BURK|nr:MAG: hypothetical protein GAK35_04169 [Herbaspirillum frisingense]
MIPDKYYVAYRHAHIMKTLGDLAEQGEDVSLLLDIAVKNGLASLRFHGCTPDDARALLVDAVQFELTTSKRAVPKCRAALEAVMGLTH